MQRLGGLAGVCGPIRDRRVMAEAAPRSLARAEVMYRGVGIAVPRQLASTGWEGLGREKVEMLRKGRWKEGLEASGVTEMSPP